MNMVGKFAEHHEKKPSRYRWFMGFAFLLFSFLLINHTPTSAVSAATQSKNTLEITVFVGKNADLSEYLKNAEATKENFVYADMTYASGDKKIVTVDKKGRLKGIKAGTAKISVTFSTTEWSDKKEDFTGVTVKKAVKVKVIPYDGSTDSAYFDYEIDNGKITICGLKKQKADIIIPAQINGFPVSFIESSAFSNDKKLKSITIKNNITEIGEAVFKDCTSLKTVHLTSPVTAIGEEAFAGCKALASIEFPKQLKTIGRSAFIACSSLKKIELPDNTVEIKEFAFSNCKSLSSVILSNQTGLIGESAFYGCNALTTVKISASSLAKKQSEKKAANGFIDVSAFAECSRLTEVEIPDGITVIEREAFWQCEKLAKISFSSRITQIGNYTFENCFALTELNLPQKLEKIGEGAFSNCTGAVSLTLPDSVREIGDYAFFECSSLSSITVNNDIQRKIGSDIFANTSYNSITKSYVDNITFHFTKEDWDHINLYQSTIKEMGIQDTDSDLEKIKKVHDWLVINTSYSFKQFYVYYDALGSVDTVLKKHFGICGAYSDTFQVFMDLLKIECIIVSSAAMDHAWNMVKLDDGCWYHIDVTWDDPGWNDEVWEKGWLRYLNLLRDDDGIKQTGHHDWDEDAPSANGSKYLNYFDHTYQVKF